MAAVDFHNTAPSRELQREWAKGRWGRRIVFTVIAAEAIALTFLGTPIAQQALETLLP